MIRYRRARWKEKFLCTRRKQNRVAQSSPKYFMAFSLLWKPSYGSALSYSSNNGFSFSEIITLLVKTNLPESERCIAADRICMYRPVSS